MLVNIMRELPLAPTSNSRNHAKKVTLARVPWGIGVRKIHEEMKMHQAMKELPLVEDYGDGFCSRLVEWGGMIVSYEKFPKGTDATPFFKGLPDDMCQSPHWGYLIKGRVRIKRKDGDDVLKTGEVYYLEPGHVPVFEEDTEILEFSPKKEYQQTIDVFEKNMAAAAQRAK